MWFWFNFFQDLMLLRSTDRIIAFAIMYQCYPSEKPSVNPFVSDMMNVSSFHRESTMLYMHLSPYLLC